ncbi:MAG: hypothetical protein ABI680_10880, partial [Chthoniobacteraceae bacterium]
IVMVDQGGPVPPMTRGLLARDISPFDERNIPVSVLHLGHPHHPLATMKLGSFFTATILLLGASATLAAGPFSGLVVFGDSLSDVGNVQQRTRNVMPASA